MTVPGILFILIVLTLFVLFVIGLVKSAGRLGWPYVTTFAFLFVPSLLFMYFAAFVLDRRVGSAKQYFQIADSVEKLEAEANRIRYGDMMSPSLDVNSLTGVLAELTRITLGRGRVWPNAQLTNINAPNYTVTLQQPALDPNAAQAPAGNDAADVGGSRLEPGMVVYAFGDAATDDGLMLPKTYLGEFNVLSNQNEVVELAPVNALEEEQKTAASASQSWSIYELMPIDSHDAFAAVGSKSDEDELFGYMDPDVISSILGVDPALAEGAVPSASVMTTDPSQYRGSLLKSYLVDGQPIDENNPPESTWELIEFTQEYEIDVDSDENRIATEGGYFAGDGRTVDSRLKRGGDEELLTFAEGDQLFVSQDAAKELVEQRNVARLVNRYFVRPLNEYKSAFVDTRQMLTETAQSIDLQNKELAIKTRIRDSELEQITIQQGLGAKLKQDLSQYEKEQAVITAELEKLQRQVADLEARLRSTYQQTQQLHAIRRGNGT